MKVLRTPSERFNSLEGYDFKENWIENLPGYEGIRIHYVDEGDKDSHVFLCLHGEPSWSYLYRKMVKVFTSSGYRCVCPDLIGFGKSDKVVEDEVYTTDFHREMLIGFIKHLNLKNVTLVIQDWGGLLGLTLPLALPQLVSSAIIMNTTFAIGQKPTDGFLMWKAFNAANEDLPVGFLFQKTNVDITEEIKTAYDAPFPSVEYKAGVRRFPELVPLNPEEPFAKLSQKAMEWWKQFQGPVFICLGTEDVVFNESVMEEIRGILPNVSPIFRVKEGHFAQEKGDIIATAALTFFHKQVSKL